MMLLSLAHGLVIAPINILLNKLSTSSDSEVNSSRTNLQSNEP